MVKIVGALLLVAVIAFGYMWVKAGKDARGVAIDVSGTLPQFAPPKLDGAAIKVEVPKISATTEPKPTAPAQADPKVEPVKPTVINAPKEDPPATEIKSAEEIPKPQETVVSQKQDRPPVSEPEMTTQPNSVAESESVYITTDVEPESEESKPSGYIVTKILPQDGDDEKGGYHTFFIPDSGEGYDDGGYNVMLVQAADEPRFSIHRELGKLDGTVPRSRDNYRRWCPRQQVHPHRRKSRNWDLRNYGGFNAHTGVPPWISTGYGPARVQRPDRRW